MVRLGVDAATRAICSPGCYSTFSRSLRESLPSAEFMSGDLTVKNKR